MSTPIDVYTSLDPAHLTDVAVDTYRQWLSFALGREQIGGKALTHPSGRYAASISWHRVGKSAIAIVADEDLAPEAKWIESGTDGADIKAAMLFGGGVTQDGYHYRRIPMKEGTAPGASAAPLQGFSIGSITQAGAQGGGTTAAFGAMWAEKRSSTEHDRVVTMTDRPGSAEWKVPAFAPYSPAAILASLLSQEYPRG